MKRALTLALACALAGTAFAAPKTSGSTKRKTKPAEETATPVVNPEAAKMGFGPAEIAQEGPDAASQEAQAAAQEGMKLFQGADFKGAEKSYQKALELAPGNPAILINLGLLAYREKKYAEAEKYLGTVLDKNRQVGLAWLVLGVVSFDQDKLEAAFAALAQAVQHSPKDARAHQYLGVTMSRFGWFGAAEDEMRKALALEPNYEEAHFNLAVLYLQRNPPGIELARRHYQRALELGANPDAQVSAMLKAAPAAAE